MSLESSSLVLKMDWTPPSIGSIARGTSICPRKSSRMTTKMTTDELNAVLTGGTGA